jgi:hypothetical protein
VAHVAEMGGVTEAIAWDNELLWRAPEVKSFSRYRAQKTSERMTRIFLSFILVQFVSL